MARRKGEGEEKKKKRKTKKTEKTNKQPGVEGAGKGSRKHVVLSTANKRTLDSYYTPLHATRPLAGEVCARGQQGPLGCIFQFVPWTAVNVQHAFTRRAGNPCHKKKIGPCIIHLLVPDTPPYCVRVQHTFTIQYYIELLRTA